MKRGYILRPGFFHFLIYPISTECPAGPRESQKFWRWISPVREVKEAVPKECPPGDPGIAGRK
jgi:hypothetical protein